MSRTLLRRAAFLIVAVVFTGCRDQQPDLLAPGAISRTEHASDATITALINQVFGPTANSTIVHWGKVVDALEAGDAADARDKLLKVADFIRSHTHLIAPPAGETKEQVATGLINLMVSYAFGTSGMGSDAVIAIFKPGTRAVIRTPDQRAAIDLPANAFSQPTVLLIYRDPVQNRLPCAGPLTTTLCQYPLFYHFEPYPHTRLNVAARMGVCLVNSGTGAVPEGIHDRLRLAHDKPADPAGYVSGGTVTQGIEILPYVYVGDFLTCGTTTIPAVTSNAPVGNSLAERGLRVLNRLASAAVALASPTTAYAIDQGGGGFLLEFSNFNVVDPHVGSNVGAPVITAEVTGTLSNTGWYTTDVNISWSVSVNGSLVTPSLCASSLVEDDTQGQPFACTAESAGGTTTVSVTIRRDKTPPVVTYADNAGTYTVDQTVEITCTASDVTSRLASNSCANISGEAYTFGAGPESRSATATDNAGNTNSATTSFDVLVTPVSLCALTQRFSSSAGIDKSLCAKLSAYKASLDRGNSVSAAGQLRAYINEVQAQSGKAILAGNATTLITLAGAL